MEFEQLVRRIEWLDSQQRKDKESLDALGERLTSVETTLNALTQQLKTLSKSVSDLSASNARLDQFDAIFAKQRTDMNTALEEIEKKSQRREREAAKRHQAELEEINRTITEMRALYDPTEIKKKLKEKSAEEIRISQAITDLKSRADEIIHANEEIQRTQKAADEARRTDLKRVADLQGDITSLRKRVDEAREKSQLNADSLRNVENRITELLAAENERKQAQTLFLEQQSLAQVERDRAWKEWRERYDSFKKQADNLDTQVQALDEALRAAKRAQDTYAELNTKLERRINEITEMQRLADERARQEMVTFKADDQKRWTSYTLSQDEAMRELRRAVEKAEQRVTEMDDAVQTLQDQLHQTTDSTEKQLQELMNWAHDWLTSTERIMGQGKKTTKKAAK
jgi:chromosome segregation ATPase